MTVGDLFKDVTFDEMFVELKAAYPDIDEASYRTAWDTIVELEPGESDVTCVVELRQPDPAFPDEEPYVNVHGVVDGEGGTWAAIEFCPWQEWLSMPVSVKNMDVTPARLLAHILWEMTFFGYRMETIKEVEDEIMDRAKDVEEMIARGDVSDLVEITRTNNDHEDDGA